MGLKKGEPMKEGDRKEVQIVYVFLLARFILFLSIPLEGVRGYGDYWNFFNIAETGWPFFDQWVEFPPIFPVLARLIYLLVGGRQHAFEYLLAFLMTGIQAANLYYFQKIAEKICGDEEGTRRFLYYAAVLIGLFYGWAYFDPFAVLTILLGIHWLFNEKDYAFAGVIGLGALIKWFPLMVIPAAWKHLSWKRALRATAVSLSVIGIVWGALYFASPDMTGASLASQYNKGSWESVWALVDGNLGTGNFGHGIDKTIPQTAYQTSGNPPGIPPWMSLVLFGGLGLVIFFSLPKISKRQMIPFTLLTMVIFFLWSPGYSPQWVLYLLPFIFLSLDHRRGLLFGVSLVLVNLLEWPVLLSRGMFQGLYLTVPLRTFLFVLLGFVLFDILKTQRDAGKNYGQE